ncbi:MAG: hypothetical protein QOK48_2335 [Blastocatellia bacterium]|jgi:tetratricopeptide (TPR) repeat protein|nr:hypothetical protein [Blastocatellia bacterium]
MNCAIANQRAAGRNILPVNRRGALRVTTCESLSTGTSWAANAPTAIAVVNMQHWTSLEKLTAGNDTDLQKRISTLLRLQVNPAGPEKNRFEEGYTEREEAHHLYVRGRHYWAKHTIEGLDMGIDHFRLAIKIDPDYALAYAGLTDCYYRLSKIHLAPLNSTTGETRAVFKALHRDDALVEGHALLGLIRIFYDHDWPVIENDFKREIELTPDSPLAYNRYGWALGMLGRFEEAISQISRALDLEPRSSEGHAGLGILLHLAGRHNAAIAQAHLSLAIHPEFFPAHVLLGVSHLQQRRLAEAVAEVQKTAPLAG